MRFLCRLEAGRALARRLEHLRSDCRGLTLLALPRGGIPVGYEVARALGLPLEVLLTHRLDAPGEPPEPFGAMAEGGSVVVDDEAVRRIGLTAERVTEIVEAASRELARDVIVYRAERPLPMVDGRCVIVVDDGITTGGSTRAAVRALRQRGARRVVVAVPVTDPRAAERVGSEADELIFLQAPADFIGVGYWYTRRGLSEEQAVSLLVRARREFGEAVPPHAWAEGGAAR